MKEGKEGTGCDFNIPAPEAQTLSMAGGHGWWPAPCQRDAPEGLACQGRLSQPARLMRPNPD